jgi:hypothetical protein
MLIPIRQTLWTRREKAAGRRVDWQEYFRVDKEWQRLCSKQQRRTWIVGFYEQYRLIIDDRRSPAGADLKQEFIAQIEKDEDLQKGSDLDVEIEAGLSNNERTVVPEGEDIIYGCLRMILDHDCKALARMEFLFLKHPLALSLDRLLEWEIKEADYEKCMLWLA